MDSNPTTCVAHLVLRTRSVVTGGTKARAGVSGTGTGTAYRTVVAGRAADGTCLPLSRPAVFELSQVKASNTVTLP